MNQAIEGYRHDVLVWAALAPHVKKKQDPPALPGVVKELMRG